MAEPNSITINVCAKLPPPGSEASIAVLDHMRELAVTCQEAGWKVSMTLTVTKEPTDG